MARRGFLTITALLACTTLLAACGGSADSGSDRDKPSQPKRAIEAVAGCENAWTDPADLAPTRKPARCKAGSPAAKPLAQRVKITVTAGSLSAEYLGPLRTAIAKGEFAKEGLDVELKQMPATDAITLLAKGQVDVLYSAPEAGMVNAVKQGFDIKWVAGNYSVAPESKTGVWARVKNGKTGDAVDLKNARFGTLVGKTSVIMYPIESVLVQHKTKPTEVSFQQLDGAGVPEAFKNGGIDAAWLLDPIWKDFEGKPEYTFLGGQPVGEPLGGMLYGQNLLAKNRDAGVAFLRALIRTVNTYFAGDYKQDPAFVQELATTLGSKPELLRSVPAQVVDWEIRGGTTDRVQKMYIEGKVVEAPALPEDKLVDRSLYAEAVGHTGP